MGEFTHTSDEGADMIDVIDPTLAMQDGAGVIDAVGPQKTRVVAGTGTYTSSRDGRPATSAPTSRSSSTGCACPPA